MKRLLVLMATALLGFLFINVDTQGQVPRNESQSESTDSSKVGGSLTTGGISINGKNYQQVGIRTDIPIGKLGFGLDIQFLLDGEGNIREEDWDEWTDYLDKIYYIRWARRNDPFYFKAGGLDYSYMGYNNIIDGYSNMVEYPAVKRYGFEMAIDTKKFGVELFLNDFKELFPPKKSVRQPSIVYGTRLSYKVIGKLEVGASIAGDLNEFNGLKDLDEDTYPDPIDQYPEDGDLVTEYDKYMNKALAQGVDSTEAIDYADKSVEYGIIDSTKKGDLFDLKDTSSTSTIYSVDIGYPIIESSNVRMEVFSHYTKIANHGWGITAPGVILGIGDFMTLRAEYRKQSKGFVYGYFNHTYELERAQIGSKMEPVTKQQRLDEISPVSMNGYYAGLDINLFGYASISANYQDMWKGTDHVRSLRGSASLKEKLLPVIHEAKAYYVQNNVKNFKEWKTPSTIMGYVMSYDFNGTIIGLDYRYTFQDINGDDKISGDDEIIKTFSFSTKMNF